MKVYLIIISFLICSLAKAQKSDSTFTRYGFYRGLSSHITELKSKRGVLNGEYKIFNGKSVAAIGIYKDDNRIGRWQFLDKDTLIQVFNYSTNVVEYNKPDKQISFNLDTVLNEGDVIKPPVKIGGILNLHFLKKYFKPPYVVQIGDGKFSLKYIFSLNEKGKLIKYETEIASTSYQKTEEIDLKRLKPEDFDFAPAQLNGKNIKSKFEIQSLIFVGRRE